MSAETSRGTKSILLSAQESNNHAFAGVGTMRKTTLNAASTFDKSSQDRVRPVAVDQMQNRSATTSASFLNHHEPAKEWSSSCPLGSQNLVSVLNDPTGHRSTTETIFTKDWGSYFIETDVDSIPVTINSSQVFKFREYIKSVRRRKKTIDKINQVNQSIHLNRKNCVILSQNLSNLIPDIFVDNKFNLTNSDVFLSILNFSIRSKSGSGVERDEAVGSSRDTFPISDDQNHIPSPTRLSSVTSEESTRSTHKQNYIKSGPQDAETSITSFDLISPQSVQCSQKKLSDLLDVVEDHLANQISAKFAQFFAIMKSIDDLMEKVIKAIREVTSARRRCDQLSRTLVKPILRNIYLKRLLENHMLYYNKLILMETVYLSSSRVNILLSSKEYVKALDLVSSSKRTVDVDLSGIRCFKHLEAELEEREKLINSIMEEDFNKLLTSEWHQPLHFDIDDCSMNGYLIHEEEILSTIINGLLKNKRVDFIKTFKCEAEAAVTTVIKQTIIEALAAEDLDISNRAEDHLFDQLKTLELRKWLTTLEDIFEKLSLLLKRIKAVNQVIMRNINLYEEKELDASSPQDNSSHEELWWTSSCEESMFSICQFSQERICTLIETRALDVTERLCTILTPNLNEFSIFAKSVESFTMDCQSLTSGRKYSKLRQVLQTQANRFATKYHEDKKKKLNSLLDIEQWKSMSNVPADFQDKIDFVFKCDMAMNGVIDPDIDDDNSHRSDGKSATISYVTIANEKFLVVNSAVLLVTLIIDYYKTSKELPVLAADLLTRLLDLLKQFNARMFKLVLNGNARQVAGLKSITTRILMNSARALELVVKLLPRIKLHFEQLLPPKQSSMTKHFEEVIDLYKDHVCKIHERVVNMSREFMSATLSKWEAKPPVPSPIFLSIIQHLGILDANLEDAVPPDQLVPLFKRIDQAFKDILRTNLTRLNIINDGGPQHGLVSPLFRSINC